MDDPAPSRSVHGVRAAAKARTRAKLLDAAGQVFADRGYGAASVEEIAKAADVSVGSIYTHFGSKKDLFVALMDQRRIQETKIAQRSLEGGFGAALDLLDRQFIALADDRHSALLNAEAWLFAVRDTSFGDRLADHRAALRQDLLPLVTAERERRGAEWTLTDEEVVHVLLALYTGLIQQRRVAGSGVGDDLCSRALTALLDGLDHS